MLARFARRAVVLLCFCAVVAREELLALESVSKTCLIQVCSIGHLRNVAASGAEPEPNRQQGLYMCDSGLGNLDGSGQSPAVPLPIIHSTARKHEVTKS